VASADLVFTPFVGMSFAGSQTEKVTTYGFSLAGMAGGIFGFELDYGKTNAATTDSVFAVNSQVTTVNGNLIVGVPLGPIRPYVVGGIGWLRNELTSENVEQNFKNDGLGVDFGGGVMGFFSDHIGVRIDMRYIRAVSPGDTLLDFAFENFNFWRFSGGVALKF
jgi:opacity protein-like surface antigen